MVVGVALAVMFFVLPGKPGAWSISLIPFLIGCVLFGAGVTINRNSAS
jgi:uncharacterized membrane protein YczE